MELMKITRRASKAQLMTIIMLVLFLLMLSVIFSLAQLNVTSNNVVQSVMMSSASNNYGNLLEQSANNFAKESLNRAILTLSNYESTPSLRKGNLIRNFSYFVSNLMMSGILPNDTSGYPQNAMGNQTLSSYNRSISSLLGFAQQTVKVNETRPIIFQTDPYNLRVAYTERIMINSSGNIYQYNIPVNASIPLNNTPDLFYSQQGVLKTVKLSSMYNITSRIGPYATSGNMVAYAYGTVYAIYSNSISGVTCPLSIASNFNTAPMNKSIIIATYNAVNLGRASCIEKYGGLVTYRAAAAPPANIPYLVYPSSSGQLLNMTNGTSVLVYGPAMSVLNIDNLRNAIANENYFTSPFTPSYIDRANAQFSKQSPNGIFTFSNYDTQSAYFNGASYITATPSGSLTGSFTIVGWAKPATTSPMDIVGTRGPSDLTFDMKFQGGTTIHGDIGTGSAWLTNSADVSLSYSTNTWYQVAYIVTQTGYTIYVNGAQAGSGTYASSTPMLFDTNHNVFIGQYGQGGEYFNGALANIQIYSTALSPMQVQQLYQEGISALPVPSNNLVGWWPLNGDAKDYSGNNNNGVPTSVTYTLLSDYNRDSIFNTQVPTSISPIPGILSCTSSAVCGSNTISQLYLGHMPLAAQGARLQVANFSTTYMDCGTTPQMINVPNFHPSPFTSISVSVWLNYVNGANGGTTVAIPGGACEGGWGDLEYRPTTNDWYFYNGIGGSSCISLNNPPLQNQFALYTLSLNGSNGAVKTYRNGVLMSQRGNWVGPIPNVGTLNIGGLAQGCFDGVRGLVSNLQVYDFALSSNMVTQLYGRGIAGIPLTSNLIGWWPLNGDANDYSGSNYNGIPLNMTYPFFAGTYNSPGMSALTSIADEWQALGLANV
jgi:hypothetical protein